MTEFSGTPGSYTSEVPGADIASILVPTYVDQKVYIQLVQGSTIRGFVEAVVRLTRLLS